MPTATLKPVKRAAKGHNRFCGPAALSIIAGIDTAEAAALLRKVSGKRSITGTSPGAVLRSLSLLGYKASSAAKLNPLKPRDNPTLAAWLRDRDSKTLYLVAAGNHWQVVQGRRFCCGLTKDIVSIRDEKVKRRARVTGVWAIEHERKVAVADVLPAKTKTPRDTFRRKTWALANRHGIQIELDTGSGPIVWGPRWASHVDEESADPFYGDHYAEGWDDALERVQAYAALITAQPELVA